MKKLLLLLLLFSTGEIMAKDDYEQRAEWEVRLQGMDPEGYKKITSDPAWMYLNEPTKLRNLIQAVADAGNKALVDTQGIPGIMLPGLLDIQGLKQGELATTRL